MLKLSLSKEYIVLSKLRGLFKNLPGLSYDVKTFISQLDNSDSWCLTQGQQQLKTTGEEQTGIRLRQGKYQLFQKHDVSNNNKFINSYTKKSFVSSLYIYI